MVLKLIEPLQYYHLCLKCMQDLKWNTAQVCFVSTLYQSHKEIQLGLIYNLPKDMKLFNNYLSMTRNIYTSISSVIFHIFYPLALHS